MAITKFSNSSLKTPNRYNDFLAGNAAYDPGGYWPIASAVGTGAQTVTMSSIPGTYKHLQIRMLSRSTSTNTGTSSFSLRINGDTGTNYAWHELFGNGSATSASGLSSANTLTLGYVINDGATASSYTATIIDILDYASTSKYKTLRIFNGSDTNTASVSFRVVLSSGLWQSTSAITSLAFSLSNNWNSSSTFELYGIKEV